MLPLAMGAIQNFLQSLKEYPPRMQSLDFNLDEAVRALTPAN